MRPPTAATSSLAPSRSGATTAASRSRKSMRFMASGLFRITQSLERDAGDDLGRPLRARGHDVADGGGQCRLARQKLLMRRLPPGTYLRLLVVERRARQPVHGAFLNPHARRLPSGG